MCFCHLTDIYRSEPARRRECLYYLALGHYKMGNFEEARKFNGNMISRLSSFLSNPATPVLLLEKEPNNLQAHSLAQLIEKGVARGTVLFYLLCEMLKLK